MRNRTAERVLMTGDTIGGVWTFTLELAARLTKAGSEVCLATFGGHATASQRAEVAEIPGLTLHDRNLKLEWMQDPWSDVEESSRWLGDLAADYRPDIIHLNSYGAGDLRGVAPVLLTSHSCVGSWWSAVKRQPLPLEWARYRNTVQGALQSADMLTAPSRAMLESTETNYGVSPREARVIPNGCRASHFQGASKEPFILTAGRLWDEAKNVQALARLAPRLPWPVYLAGERKAPDGRDPHLPYCRMLGHLPPDSLAEWYGRASIYALPARYEPFGLSALEAALSGCALVLGDIATLREIWGDAALFVPPDDSSKFEKALRELIDSPETLLRMASAARKRARNYKASRMAAGYRAAYRSCISRRRVCAA
jgi:glycogen(starch) synthase